MPLSIEEKLKEYFKLEKQKDQGILNQIILFVYFLESQSTQSDLFILGRLLSSQDLYKLISYFDGDIIKMPSKEEFKKAYIVAISYYLKEIKHLDWNEVKTFLPETEDFAEYTSPTSLGRRVSQVKEKMTRELFKLINELDIDTIKEKEKEILNV